jgi:hypothetical protein
METEFITMQVQDVENLYVLLGTCLGILIGGMVSFMYVKLRDQK